MRSSVNSGERRFGFLERVSQIIKIIEEEEILYDN